MVILILSDNSQTTNALRYFELNYMLEALTTIRRGNAEEMRKRLLKQC